MAAQTPNQFLSLQGYPQHGYIEIPADTALDSPQMTVEAWVSIHDAYGTPGGCSSIAGNGYLTGWWLGVCGTTMRSYFNGVSSEKSGGTIPVDTWVHIAAVTDGTTRKHYINGELVFQSAETAPRSTSTNPVRIGSDPNWDFMVAGQIDDLRIWSVARTQDQIRQTMFVRYTPGLNPAQFSSLEAWYAFEGNGNDSWHTHHGTMVGNGFGFAQGNALPNQYLTLPGYPTHGYIEILADTVLDTPQMTIEAWVSVHDAHNTNLCSSIAGNGYTTGWWLGVCGTSMRSYFNGGGSSVTGGTIPADTWVHIAAVTDGTTHKHYINGNLVFQALETATRSTSTRAPRIGSDPDWDYQVAGAIDDLRIWSVARTQEQIRDTMFVRYSSLVNSAWFPSLEAWYSFEGDGKDSWHTHNGTINGTLGFAQGLPFSVPKHRGVGH
ncbi:MAG TPA: LamG domain-containing protein [Thermoanaerobaculia bacterium]|nr:LamG domain-containing protein [Thermoanaerobaculia bacterium]